MSKNKGSNKENFEKTAKIFLDIARKEFIEHGYANASTERIVEESGMARGSLYYHYGNKEGVFRAVYEEVVKEVGARISTKMKKENDAFLKLKKGCRYFYEECDRADVRCIMLIEGITNIPYKERVKILEPNMIILIRECIEDLQSENKLAEFDQQAIMVFIYGMLAEAGRTIEYIGNTAFNTKRYADNLDILLDKLIKN